ncbi:hypothetical protein B0H19DRAFT_1373264 [Mycena capillaripes]|nr:hypothetical protein B0H19DRAFT_1373264 [Mycena capillaripes]
MAIYYDDYDHDYSDPPAQYYNPEPTYYEPEPAYYNTEPVYENESYSDDQGFDDALEADVYEDFGEGFAPDIPSHGEEITEEEFYEGGGVEADVGEREKWDGTRYDLHNSLEYIEDGESLWYAPEVVYAPLSIELAHATEAEIDAACDEELS